MVNPRPHNTDQLTGDVDRLRTGTLIVPTIPLLRAAFHLRRIVGRQGQALEAATSSNGARRNEVVQGQRVEGSKGAAGTLHSLIDRLGQRIRRIWIVTGSMGVLDVVLGLELLEPLRMGVVNVLGVGDEGRRRRSTGSRHFVWRMGGWCKTQQLTLLLAAHVRHGLIWSSLPLPQDSSVHRSDKPQIFLSHSDPKPFGVWC